MGWVKLTFSRVKNLKEMAMALRRSVMFVSGSTEEGKLREIISTCGADLVCLDLEDTVPPAQKPAARQLIARLLKEDIWGRSDRAVRINAVSTPWAHDDIVEVLTGSDCRVDTLICSKVESDHDVWWIDHLVSDVVHRTGATGKENIKLSIGIETAGALTYIDKLATASKRIESLGFAIGDLSISLGVRVAPFLKDRSLYPGDLFHFVRSRINLAAKTHGLQALDGPWPIINDHVVLAEDARWAAMLGFDGKIALDVGQIKVIHLAYRPTEVEIVHARKVLATIDQMVAKGEAAGVLDDGEFLDLVSIGMAHATLERAEAPL